MVRLFLTNVDHARVRRVPAVELRLGPTPSGRACAGVALSGCPSTASGVSTLRNTTVAGLSDVDSEDGPAARATSSDDEWELDVSGVGGSPPSQPDDGRRLRQPSVLADVALPVDLSPMDGVHDSVEPPPLEAAAPVPSLASLTATNTPPALRAALTAHCGPAPARRLDLDVHACLWQPFHTELQQPAAESAGLAVLLDRHPGTLAVGISPPAVDLAEQLRRSAAMELAAATQPLPVEVPIAAAEQQTTQHLLGGQGVADLPMPVAVPQLDGADLTPPDGAQQLLQRWVAAKTTDATPPSTPSDGMWAPLPPLLQRTAAFSLRRSLAPFAQPPAGAAQALADATCLDPTRLYGASSVTLDALRSQQRPFLPPHSLLKDAATAFDGAVTTVPVPDLLTAFKKTSGLAMVPPAHSTTTFSAPHDDIAADNNVFAAMWRPLPLFGSVDAVPVPPLQGHGAAAANTMLANADGQALVPPPLMCQPPPCPPQLHMYQPHVWRLLSGTVAATVPLPPQLAHRDAPTHSGESGASSPSVQLLHRPGGVDPAAGLVAWLDQPRRASGENDPEPGDAPLEELFAAVQRMFVALNSQLCTDGVLRPSQDTTMPVLQ